MSERGTVSPSTTRTTALPALGSAAGSLVAIPVAGDRSTVAVGLSFASSIRWCFASSASAAVAAFAAGDFASYRGTDTNLEIPCVGTPGTLYIESLSNPSPVAGGLSFWAIRGGER